VALSALAVGSGILAGAWALRAAVRYRRYIELKGKSVLVTGGSRGLGLAIAREFAKAGAKVAICARTGEETERAAFDLSHYGNAVHAVQADITLPYEAAYCVDQVVERFGSIDVLINNAGTIEAGPMQHMEHDDYQHAMNTHFWAPYYLVSAAVPHMRKRRGGRIANISSFGGKVAVPHLLPYSASKFALTGFSEGLRSELAADNIFVTTVCPGLIRTGSAPHAIFKGQQQQEYRWFVTGANLPLVTIDPKRLAKKVVDAVRHGDAELIAPFYFRLQTTLNGILPGVVSELMAIANRLLPGPTESFPGNIGLLGRDASGLESDLIAQRNARAGGQLNE